MAGHLLRTQARHCHHQDQRDPSGPTWAGEPHQPGGGDVDLGCADPAGAPQVGEPGQDQPLGHRLGGEGGRHGSGARHRLRDQLCPGAAARHQGRGGGRGGPVTVSGSYNAVTGSRIAGNVQPEVKAKLTLDGRSVIGGESVILIVPRASLAPRRRWTS